MSTQHTNKMHAGTVFPELTVNLLSGETVKLGDRPEGVDWKLVLVYRGRHCPLCTRYLNQLQQFKQPLADIGVDIIAVSGDSKAQLESHMAELEVDFPLAYGLTIEQMQALGLYISEPRSEQETDHSFAEPGLFVVNQDGNLQVVDISNNPFTRPELQTLVNGLSWVKDPNNNYPIRGTYS